MFAMTFLQATDQSTTTPDVGLDSLYWSQLWSWAGTPYHMQIPPKCDAHCFWWWLHWNPASICIASFQRQPCFHWMISLLQTTQKNVQFFFVVFIVQVEGFFFGNLLVCHPCARQTTFKFFAFTLFLQVLRNKLHLGVSLELFQDFPSKFQRILLCTSCEEPTGLSLWSPWQ